MEILVSYEDWAIINDPPATGPAKRFYHIIEHPAHDGRVTSYYGQCPDSGRPASDTTVYKCVMCNKRMPTRTRDILRAAYKLAYQMC